MRLMIGMLRQRCPHEEVELRGVGVLGDRHFRDSGAEWQVSPERDGGAWVALDDCSEDDGVVRRHLLR